MSFPKLLRPEHVIHSSRITLFGHAVPNFVLVLRPFEMLWILLFADHRFVTVNAVKIFRIPRVIVLQINLHQNLLDSAMVLYFNFLFDSMWRESTKTANSITQVATNFFSNLAKSTTFAYLFAFEAFDSVVSLVCKEYSPEDTRLEEI